MDTINQVAQWVASNGGEIVQGFLTVVGGLSVIARFTPTPKDDAVLASIVKLVDLLALNKKR